MDVNTLLDFAEQLLEMPGGFFARTLLSFRSQKTREKGVAKSTTDEEVTTI